MELARVHAANNDKIYQIEEWFGVNENPEGDTGLRLGEAAAMLNFKITNNKKIQKRPGTQNIANLLFSYDVAIDDTPTTILTETIASTATFQAYPSIDINDGGLLFVTGMPVTVDDGTISGHAGKYYRDTNGVIYQLGVCDYTPGTGETAYRWSKWSCSVSSGSTYYLSGSFEAYMDKSLSPGEYCDGYTSYDFNYSGGTYSNAGTPAGIPYGTTGSNYLAFSDCVYRHVVTQEGPEHFRLVTTKSAAQGPYYSGPTYSKGSTPYGYVYGASGTYPDNACQSDGSTWYWYDGKVMNATYTWKFYRVSMTANAGPSPVRGIWSGRIGTSEVICAACDGRLWQLSAAGGTWSKAAVGQLNTDNKVHFFGFDSKLYMLSGLEYKVWDGTTLADVAGYRPLVALARTCDGAQSTPREPVNMLNGQRRVWFSPDGTHTVFNLPEQALAAIDYAKTIATGAALTIASSNLVSGTVTFASAPAAGTNAIEIGYSVGTSLRAQIEAMTLAEYYNGENDNRVFVYGDGSNKAFYSGLDYNGRPTAEYFPDLNVVHIGDSNTPLYDLLRHYNELIAFKDGAAYRIRYGQLTLVTGALTAAFYVETINKGVGGSGYGQAQLVENHPRSLDGRSIYEWVAATPGGGIASNQRNAERISQKVEATMRQLELTKAVTFYDKIGHEYYIVENGLDGSGIAIVQNTENGAWYIYRNFPAVCMIVYRDEVYYGTADGYIRHLSHSYRHDCGAEIVCSWESGAEAFGKNFMRKYTDELYIVPKQEPGAFVSVALLTDGAASPGEAQNVVSFSICRQPKTHRKKIKARGYTWLKLLFSSASTDTTVTILSASIKVRETGIVKKDAD